jgi:hypothetical protein
LNTKSPLAAKKQREEAQDQPERARLWGASSRPRASTNSFDLLIIYNEAMPQMQRGQLSRFIRHGAARESGLVSR